MCVHGRKSLHELLSKLPNTMYQIDSVSRKIIISTADDDIVGQIATACNMSKCDVEAVCFVNKIQSIVVYPDESETICAGLEYVDAWTGAMGLVSKISLTSD